MIGFYAMGGGLGHLTRVQTFIRNKKFKGPIRVLTANKSAFHFFSAEEVLMIHANDSTTPSELAQRISDLISKITFEHWYIDTFPCGILGELGNVPIQSTSKHLLARRMLWRNYYPLITHIETFTSTYTFEPLESDHQHFIKRNSKTLIKTSLDYTSDRKIIIPKKKSSASIWLIVHSTHQQELLLLIDHAMDIAMLEKKDPEFVVISDVNVLSTEASIRVLTNENPLNWYPLADRIITAGGFNTWHQLKPWRAKHIALPFKRKFDDQFWRVTQT
ncbi:MAG: hypothetical protein AAF843_11160 [Bacteroidota bacterium]